MSDEVAIHVNFSKPMPIFPLDAATLLPQQILPLHIFEERYRQMVTHALDSAGQIAMGVFEGSAWKQEYHGRPPLRSAVCIGQITQHESLPDGRYNILLQGVCRARIARELPPEPGILYRRALLRPVGVQMIDESSLEPMRDWLGDVLSDGPLEQMRAAQSVLSYVHNDAIPTSALLELVSFTMTGNNDLRYQLLEEGNPLRRAELIKSELTHIGQLIEAARAQHPEKWPKGVSWN